MSGGFAGRGYVPALDGLRALAVIGVIAFHDDRLPGGFLGVDLFFALSGFLITSLLLDEHAREGRIDLVGFWGRRLRRLMPAVVALLVVTVVVFRLAADAGEWIVARGDAPWAQFYVANWHLIASGAGYWDAFAAPSAFEHLWSLAIEEQFYLVWPIVVAALLRRGGTASVGAVALVGAVGSTVAMTAIFDGGDPTRVYMGTDTRAFSLLVGAALAAPGVRNGVVRFVERARGAAGVVAAMLVAGVGVMWVVADGDADWLFRGGLPAHSVASALLAVLVVAGAPGSGALSWRPLVTIGRLSYSLYLWHWPVFVFCSPERVGVDGWSLTAVRVTATAILSTASYLVVEQPLRHRAGWAHGRSGRATFAGVTVSMVALWAVIPIPATTNTVDDSALRAVLSSTTVPSSIPASIPSTIPSTTPSTSPTLTAVPTSTTSSTSSVPPTPAFALVTARRILWYGDSVAADLWPPFAAALDAIGIVGASGAYGGVGLTVRDGIPDPIGRVAEHIDTHSPDLLVMPLSLWDAYATPDEQKAGLEALVELTGARGVPLVLITIPVRSPDTADPGEAAFIARARAVADAHADRVLVLDVTEVFGDEFALDVDGDGTPERKRDGVHLCPTGALAVTTWLLGELDRYVDGVGPPTSTEWVLGDWRTDDRYDDPPGACAAL
jgi:peptidoglycan/LPS O-acetylase OafA/YrhL